MSPLTPEQRQRLYNAFVETEDPLAWSRPPALQEAESFYYDGYITYTGLLALLPVLQAIAEEQAGHP